ncbi:ADP-heptose--LPS heptosyltransferase 2 [bacterium BMS3Abin04]|nr:ADP-heptose--LPS heptosyltransferase 2 [bacterium BMS3Abin04]
MVNISEIKSVLIIRLSSLGDVLLTTPLIRTLRNKYPNISIDFVVKESYLEALKYNIHLRQILTYHPDRTKELTEQLKKKRYNLVIDLQNNLRSNKISSKLKARKVVFKKPTLKKFLLVKFKINLLTDKKPIPVLYSQSVKSIELDGKGLELFIPSEIKSGLDEDKYIGFCPGSRHFTKMWPAEYFIELGNMLTQNGFKIVLFGGRDDKEITDQIEKRIKYSINLCNNNKLLQTAKDMKKCSLVVCNDSGLMHTASAVQTPVAAVFGSTVQEFGFSPYKAKAIILENKSLSCRPCSHIGRDKCPKDHFKCMLDIKPKDVYNNIIQFYNSL